MKITIHCSAMPNKHYHDIKDIEKWHKARGFTKVGYNYVITSDGKLQRGRKDTEMGAHVYGNNRNNIGICLCGLGPHDFTSVQGDILYKLVFDLMCKYDVALEDVRGHYEYDSGKACPNINMPIFRASINFILSLVEK